MDHAIVQELTESRLPIVFYDVGTAGGNITKIRVNYRKGVERVVEYLASLGHEQLAFIGHHAVLGPIDERRRALFDTARVVCPYARIRVAADSDSLEGGQQAVREILSEGLRNQRPSSCVNDLMAVGALKELRERGMRVPPGHFSNGLRQHQAFGVLLSGPDDGTHPARSHRPYAVHQSRAGFRRGDHVGQGVRH